MFEFLITRASDESKNIRPCKEAFYAGKSSLTLSGHAWKIRFETLEELLAFISREGSIVIGEVDDGIFQIIIYDDYIE